MTRLMYDGITPASVPSGAQIYAGYVGGEWPSYAALAAAHPAALHVSIAVNAEETARVLDVETGDASPAEAPGWVSRQRADGNPYPAVYMNMTTWPAVKAAFAEQQVAPPLYWVALYVTDPANVPDIPDGAIAIQYYGYGGYDASSVADYWPGVDPAPVTTATPTATTAQLEEEDAMSTSVNGRAGLSWASGSRHVLQISGDPGVIGAATFRAVINVKQPEGNGPYQVAAAVALPHCGAVSIEIPQQYVADACAGYVYCSNPAVPFELLAV
jgi:hypothetical protein